MPGCHVLSSADVCGHDKLLPVRELHAISAETTGRTVRLVGAVTADRDSVRRIVKGKSKGLQASMPASSYSITG